MARGRLRKVRTTYIFPDYEIVREVKFVVRKIKNGYEAELFTGWVKVQEHGRRLHLTLKVIGA